MMVFCSICVHMERVENFTDSEGRPIVSGCGGLCEPTCRFLDYYLRPCVESLPSYVRDSMDVLRHLDGMTFEQDMFLVCCDFESLYTCIHNDHRLRAVRFYLNMQNLAPDLIELLLSLLEFILCHNYFLFMAWPWEPRVLHHMPIYF